MKCIDSFKNINVMNHSNVLKIAPCCFSPPRQADTVDFYNNEYLTRVRNSWNQGNFPYDCHRCKQQESLGRVSRRIGSNQWYKDNGIDNTDVELVRLDYWVGDHCNLACAICGPSSSSTWKQELGLSKQEKKSVVNKFWKTLDLSKLRFVHFNGGEPLLSKEHVELLNAIQHKQEVCINYNTNGTIQPSVGLIELWKEFKLVQIDFSIDDVEERFEYQRYPAKWNQVTDNLKWFVENAPHNCMFAVNTTVSILNESNTHALATWLQKNFSISKFNDPIDHRYQSVITGSLIPSNGLQHIRSYLDSLDRRRGTSWQSTFPELVSKLSYKQN